MTNSTFVTTDGSTVNQSSGMIRMITNGAGEATYWNLEDASTPQIIYVYEGGNRLLRLTTANFDHARRA